MEEGKLELVREVRFDEKSFPQLPWEEDEEVCDEDYVPTVTPNEPEVTVDHTVSGESSMTGTGDSSQEHVDQEPSQQEVDDTTPSFGLEPAKENDAGDEVVTVPNASSSNGDHRVNQLRTQSDESSSTNVSRPSRRRNPPRGIFSPSWTPGANRAVAMRHTNEVVPNSYSEAIASPQSAQWKAAMETEIDSMKANRVWTLTDRQNLVSGQKVVGNRWIFKTKASADYSSKRYKARLVYKGYRQEEGVDYHETYAPVASLTTIRLLVAISVMWKTPIHQMDVKTAFLNGDLDEELYMEQPPGYKDPSQPNAVCKLDKSIYGLKQAPLQWYKKLSSVLIENDFSVSEADSGLFILKDKQNLLLLGLYVDDIILVSTSSSLRDAVKHILSKNFQMTNLGEASMILGIEVGREGNNVSLTQTSLILETLESSGMAECKPTKTPMETGLVLPSLVEEYPIIDESGYRRIVGKLIHIANSTKPDISYAVAYVSRFSSKPGTAHWQAVKRILRYLAGTALIGLSYTSGGDYKLRHEHALTCFSDADWAYDRNDRKSTSGFAVFFDRHLISWGSKKQNVVALSTMEAEYISLARGAQETIWLQKLFRNLPISILPAKLWCDNQSAIAFSRNQDLSARSKHINIKYFFVRDYLRSGLSKVMYCPTSHMIADVLTKALPAPAFESLRTPLLNGLVQADLQGEFVGYGSSS